jgi:osmotically-inducible protein OsmY
MSAQEGPMTDQDISEGPYRGRGPRTWSRSDARIREEVCERLLQDRLLDARGIEVQVRDGVVGLEGHVPGASDITHADSIARGAPGVVHVENRLRYEPGTRRVDRPDPEEPMGQRTPWGKWVPPFTP